MRYMDEKVLGYISFTLKEYYMLSGTWFPIRKQSFAFVFLAFVINVYSIQEPIEVLPIIKLTVKPKSIYLVK